jgi:hypothetical protein
MTQCSGLHEHRVRIHGLDLQAHPANGSGPVSTLWAAQLLFTTSC